MLNAQRTPGPWTQDRDAISANGKHIAFAVGPEGAGYPEQKANAAFIVEACNNYERVCAERNELVTVLNAIRIQAIDAQLRASYQRTALEQISAEARAALAKVTP